jgi:MFS family permease
MAEWTFFIGGLVYAYDKGGAGATGIASLAMLVPTALAAPYAGSMTHRRRPQVVRLAAYAVQTVALGGAALAAFGDAPTAAVVGCCAVAAAAFTFLGPTGAVVLPGIVRSARELTVGNVWLESCESVGVLVGSFLSTLLLEVQGPALVLAGGAVLSLISTIITVPESRTGSPPASLSDDADSLGPVRLLLSSVRALRSRARAGGVLAMACGHFILVGSIDIIVVVLARDELDLGDSGPGLLQTSVGVGALICAVASTLLLRRPRLSSLLVVATCGIAGASLVLGVAPTVAAALILLPIIGFGGSLLNLTSRMLLQRSTPPDAAAGAFAALELFMGIGMIAGALCTQLLIAAGGGDAALIGLGSFFGLLVLLTWRSLAHADDSADIPVVAISLLRRIPLFTPLPPLALEAVARAATEISVPSGDVVVSEGDPGDLYYAVADGSFDVTCRGVFVTTLERGRGFGEVALLTNVPRTATVTASRAGSLLAIHRVPFLVAVTGSDSSRQAAWGAMRTMGLDVDADDVPTLDM